MFDFMVHSIGHYQQAEKNTYINPCCTIGFTIAGFKWYRFGKRGKIIKNPKPFLAINPAGMEIAFETTGKRNNWAILLETEDIGIGCQPETIELNIEKQSLVLPVVIPIVSEHVSGWEGEFIRIYDAFCSPTPSNQVRCKLGVYNIFRYFIDRKPDVFFSSPADKLKWLIDQDKEMIHSLEELSKQCGYSTDHLRIIFHKAYGLNPQEYRNRMRMAYAMDLISNSNLLVSEIGVKTGFPYVAHFSRMFKSTFHLTPREGIQRFRNFTK